MEVKTVLKQWLLIAVVILIVLALLYVLEKQEQREQETGDVMVFKLSAAESRPFKLAEAQPSNEPALCMNTEMREKIREIMLIALDEALKDHIVNVFTIWLRDETGQPGRARQGVKQGVAAYVRSRDSMQKWDPPQCPTR